MQRRKHDIFKAFALARPRTKEEWLSEERIVALAHKFLLAAWEFDVLPEERSFIRQCWDQYWDPLLRDVVQKAIN